jgi:hypothetical protein
LGAIVLYVISDKILERIEIARGKRFQHRSFIFFIIIFTLALGYISLISSPPEDLQQGETPQPIEQNP